VDPHRHVDEELLADAALVDPAPGQSGGRGEAVVEVDAETAFQAPGAVDHPLGLGDGVADGLLAEDMGASLQGSDGLLCVVGVGRADGYQIRLDLIEHLLPVAVVLRNPRRFGKKPRPLGEYIGRGDELDVPRESLP